jgi:signal recognition particle GTPase
MDYITTTHYQNLMSKWRHMYEKNDEVEINNLYTKYYYYQNETNSMREKELDEDDLLDELEEELIGRNIEFEIEFALLEIEENIDE